MGPVLDLKERKGTTQGASTSKQHTGFVSMAKDKNMKSDSKNVMLNEHEVDVSKNKNDEEGASGQPQSGDATASSSSFSNVLSDFGDCELESDNEVMSDFRGDLLSVR